MLSLFLLLSVSTNKCQDCKSLAMVLENLVKSNTPKEKYSEHIIQNCNKLPKVLQSRCNSYARENVDTILERIKQGVPANQTCVDLKFCTSVNEDVDVFLEAEKGEWTENKPNWAISWDEEF